MNVIWTLIILIGLAGCGGRTDGTYVGLLTTQQGLCGMGEDSRANAPATLSLRGKDAQFEPEDGVIMLEGHIDNAGHVLAQSNAPGADHKPFPQVFEGDLTANRVSGRFATPRCRAIVTLTRH